LGVGEVTAVIVAYTRQIAERTLARSQSSIGASVAVRIRPDVIVSGGPGSPEGAVSANVGSLWLRTDGGTGTTLYVKQSGTGPTGWVAK